MGFEGLSVYTRTQASLACSTFALQTRNVSLASASSQCAKQFGRSCRYYFLRISQSNLVFCISIEKEKQILYLGLAINDLIYESNGK